VTDQNALLITTVMPGATGSAAFETGSTAGATAAIGRPPRLSGRPPRLSGPTPRLSRPRSRPPLRTGAWKRERGVCRRCAQSPREVFNAGPLGANTGGASFAREKNRVVLDGRCSFGQGFARGSRDHFFFGMLGLGALILAVFVVAMFVFVALVLTMSSVVFGVFLSTSAANSARLAARPASTSVDSSAESSETAATVLPQILPCLLPFVLPTLLPRIRRRQRWHRLSASSVASSCLASAKSAASAATLIFVQLSVIPGGVQAAAAVSCEDSAGAWQGPTSQAPDFIPFRGSLPPARGRAFLRLRLRRRHQPEAHRGATRRRTGEERCCRWEPMAGDCRLHAG